MRDAAGRRAFCGAALRRPDLLVFLVDGARRSWSLDVVSPPCTDVVRLAW